VELEGVLQVFGEDCCGRLFGWDRTRPAPRVQVQEGRRLTAAEREKLVANTRALLDELEGDVQRSRLEMREKLQSLKARAPHAPMLSPGQGRAKRAFAFPQPPEPRSVVREEAIRRMAQRWQLDEQQALSPGWASLFRDVIAEIERERQDD